MWHVHHVRRAALRWLRAALGRIAVTSRADADARASGFIRGLEDTLLELEARGHRFEQARHKSDHVEELRRVLGALLDVLADWEAATGPAG
jgi:hypothetical protein